MFSVAEKQQIAAAIEKILLDLKHPEMPTEKPRFTLLVDGKESWSWAAIQPNWVFGPDNPPGVNPWNERVRQAMKPDIEAQGEEPAVTRQEPKCLACDDGEQPVMIDDDGTLCSVSGRPGYLGHARDDFFWKCERAIYAAGRIAGMQEALDHHKINPNAFRAWILTRITNLEAEGRTGA